MHRIGRGWVPKNLQNHIDHIKGTEDHTGQVREIKPSELSPEQLNAILNDTRKGRK